MALSGKVKLNGRLGAAGEHVAKASSAELELHSVSIVNGYRAPMLLRDESGSARAELMRAGAAPLLHSALAKLQTLEMKRRFRHDASSSSSSGAAPLSAARPGIVLGAASDKGERFFRNLLQPRLPLEDCFEIPKLGIGLFVQGLLRFAVPPPRAVWAIRAAYPSVSSADLIREVFEKVLNAKSGADWSRQMEYAQCLLGGLIGEGLITLEKLVEAVFSDQGSRKAFLCQFLCPFLDELYCTRPALLVGDRFKDFGDAESGALARLAVWNEVPVPFLFESLEEVISCAMEFISEQHSVHGLSGVELAVVLEAEPFAVLELGTLFGLFEYASSLVGGVCLRASRLFACKFLLGVLRHLRAISRAQITEALFMFSLRKPSMELFCLVWSELIRSSTLPFSRLARLLTVSAVAPVAATELVQRVSCPIEARAERERGNELCNVTFDVHARCLVYLASGSLGELDAVFQGAAEFDLDASWTDMLHLVEEEAAAVLGNSDRTVNALCGCVARLHRLIDVLLLYPTPDGLLSRLAELMDGSTNPLGLASLISLLSRTWPFPDLCVDAKEKLRTRLQTVNAQLSTVVECAPSDDCMGVVQRGCVPSSEALSALLLATRPECFDSLLQMLLAHPGGRFDPLMFLAPQHQWENRSFGQSSHLDIWRIMHLQNTPRTEALLDVWSAPEHFSLWKINKATISAELANRKGLELAERIAKEEPNVRLWLGLFVCVKKMTGLHAKVCSLVLPVVLSTPYRSLLSRQEYASMVALVLGLTSHDDFESTLRGVSSPDMVCLTLLERVLPLNLAGMLQMRIIDLKPDATDPFLVEGAKSRAALLRDPQNLVRGWTVLSKPQQTLLARIMDGKK